ncbi:hypothetical protein GGI12_004332 [Dipsacomyces acuminosporus]|nr:hypothetical protein GGI12_004332 [Dipsacomyces acuminosporus]
MSSLPSLDEESEHQHGGDAGQSSINFSGAPSTSGSAPGSANMPDERSVRHNDCTGDETANISADGGIFPEVPDDEGVLPTYMDVEDSSPMSDVVRQWRLGEHAIEKPSIHPLGYRYPASSVTSS